MDRFHRDSNKPTGFTKQCKVCKGSKPKSHNPGFHICYTCKEEKPKDKFYKDVTRPLGHDGSCIECKRLKRGYTRRNNVGGKECTNCQKVKYLYEFPYKGYLKGIRKEHLDMCKTCYYKQDVIPKGLKKCYTCKYAKGLASFNRDRSYRDGLSIHCRECSKVKGDTYKNRNYRASGLWASYKITLDDYNKMLEEQNGMCALPSCETTKESSGKYLHVDHDHNCCPGKKSCGKCVRALLCSVHNSMLGFGHDSPQELREGADYLERYNK